MVRFFVVSLHILGRIDVSGVIGRAQEPGTVALKKTLIRLSSVRPFHDYK